MTEEIQNKFDKCAHKAMDAFLDGTPIDQDAIHAINDVMRIYRGFVRPMKLENGRPPLGEAEDISTQLLLSIETDHVTQLTTIQNLRGRETITLDPTELALLRSSLNCRDQ